MVQSAWERTPKSISTPDGRMKLYAVPIGESKSFTKELREKGYKYKVKKYGSVHAVYYKPKKRGAKKKPQKRCKNKR